MVENDYNSSKDNTDTINDELIREISRLKLDKEIDNTKESFRALCCSFLDTHSWKISEYCLLFVIIILAILLITGGSDEIPKTNDGYDIENGLCNPQFIGDGVCDEITNVQQCSYDGGDCCLSRKETSLCKNCTCTFNIDSKELEAAKTDFNVSKYFFNSTFEFSQTDVVHRVKDVIEEDVCSLICLDKTLLNVISWFYDKVRSTCICLNVFQKFECSLVPSNDSPTYLNVLVTKTCTATCGNDEKKFLHEKFTDRWGKETSYIGCIQDGFAHGSGKAETVTANDDLVLFDGFWHDGYLEGKGKAEIKETGEVYKGDWSNGLYHGHGELFHPGVYYYVGQYEAGKRSGQGWMERGNGDLYSGSWFNDTEHGNGSYVFHIGDAYYGGYNNGLKHGFGKYVFANGENYIGNYQYDKKHGYGIYTWSDGNFYEGDFFDGYLHGHGKFVYVSGAFYEGPYWFNKRNGHGMFVFASGTTYVGDFWHGYFHGHGTKTYASGSVYEGDWNCDEPTGYGKYTFSDGTYYEGQFVNGFVQGQGKYVSAGEENTYEGEFVDDIFHGLGTFTWDTGEVFIGNFVNGEENDDNGLYIEADGTEYTGKWENGQPVGSHTRKDGKQVDTVCVKVENGHWDWHEDCN